MMQGLLIILSYAPEDQVRSTGFESLDLLEWEGESKIG